MSLIRELKIEISGSAEPTWLLRIIDYIAPLSTGTAHIVAQLLPWRTVSSETAVAF